MVPWDSAGDLHGALNANLKRFFYGIVWPKTVKIPSLSYKNVKSSLFYWILVPSDDSGHVVGLLLCIGEAGATQNTNFEHKILTVSGPNLRARCHSKINFRVWVDENLSLSLSLSRT